MAQAKYFTETTKVNASMPTGRCLGALDICSSRNLQCPQRVPLSKEKMHWCPCPFKHKVYKPDGIKRKVTENKRRAKM